MFFYILQQKLYISLISGISEFRLSILILFFAMGIITSLTPCFISVVPISFAFINSDRKNAMHKNNFIIGLCISLFIFLFVVNIFNYKYINYISNVPIISLFFMVFVALSFLQIIDLSIFTNKLSIFLSNIKHPKEDNISTYISGVLVGISTLPCTSPIIYIIAFWISHSISIFFSLTYLITYMLGYIASILLIFNVTFNYSRIYLILSASNFIGPLSGFCILTFSLFKILEKLFY
uniref:Thiol:disulfide interchange protein n=1 Tax=Anotrichium furcellatum TaxID=41999 RepID=A0A4D6WN76_9FLOR|nr:Thiol:disulfide interchange protein [Anotrichium furcellatum]